VGIYPKIAHEVMSYQAIFILEVYAYLVVAVTCKIRSSHAGLSENNSQRFVGSEYFHCWLWL